MTDLTPSLTPFLQAELSRAWVLAHHANRLLDRRVDLADQAMPGRVWGDGTPRFGHEAAAVGAVHAIRRRTDGSGDVFAASVRTLTACLSLGVSPAELFRQALGRAGSPDEGRAAPLHLHDLRRGVVGPIQPLGMVLEVMAGLTLGFRLQGGDRVAVAFAGEGAPSSGAWHEGLNLAAVRRCPLVVMIDVPNPVGADTGGGERGRSLEDLCEAYGVTGHRPSGTGPGAVFRSVQDAVDRARSGDGVQIVEYRPTDPDPIGSDERLGRWHREAVDRLDPPFEAALEEESIRERASRGRIFSDLEPESPWYRTVPHASAGHPGGHEGSMDHEPPTPGAAS